MTIGSAILAALASMTSATSDELPAGAFGWMGELAGHCWSATYPDGTTRDTQCYSAQYGRYLRGTIEIRSSAGGRPPYLGDSVFFWNPETSEMSFNFWSNGGRHGTSIGRVEGDSIVFPDPPSTDPNAPRTRAHWTRLGPTSYRVTLQRQSGDRWEDSLSVTYSRTD